MPNLGGVNGVGINGGAEESSSASGVAFGEFNRAEFNILPVNGPNFLSAYNASALLSILQSVAWYMATVKIININQDVLLRSTFSSSFLLEINQNIKFIWT